MIVKCDSLGDVRPRTHSGSNPGSFLKDPPVAENEQPRIFSQLSDELKRVFGAQLARLEAQLKAHPHSMGPRKPDLAELESHLLVDPTDESEPTELGRPARNPEE